jgi:hypothetical protein
MGSKVESSISSNDKVTSTPSIMLKFNVIQVQVSSSVAWQITEATVEVSRGEVD